MLIFFMPDWLLNVKPNCNGIVQKCKKVNRLWIVFKMFGGLSDYQDGSLLHSPLGRIIESYP